MEHDLYVYQHLTQEWKSGNGCTLGLVVEAKGSTPQKPGAKMLISASGKQFGTVGGGLVESEALMSMRDALNSGRPAVKTFRLDDTYSREAGPICGGYMRIAILPCTDAVAEAAEFALQAHADRVRGILAFPAEANHGKFGYLCWYPDSPDIDFEFTEALRAESCGTLARSDGTRWYVEPVCTRPRLLVVGGGHVGQEVVYQAHRLGFEISVVDDRAEFTRSELFPEGVHPIHGNIGEAVLRFPKGPDAYIVLVSKGHRPDAEALEACIDEPLAYLGMIGSARKIRLLREDFVRRGLATAELFDRVSAPIGVDIGAVSVPEIGVSIAAQLIAARRRGSPLPESLRMPKPGAAPGGVAAGP